MNELVRSIRLVVWTAFRTAPLLAAATLVLSPVAQMVGQLSGLWLKHLADAAVARDAAGASRATLLLAGSLGLMLLAGRFAFELRQTLSERVRAAVEKRVLELSASLPGLEHHEHPEYHDKLQLLRSELGQLGSAMNQFPEVVGMAGRLVITGVLLASVHPVLLALPVCSVPSLFVAAAAQRRTRRAQERHGESYRLAAHMLRLGTDPGAGKELRVFNLQPEIRSRHEAAWGVSFRAFRRAQLVGATQLAASSVLPSLGYAAAIGLVAWQAARGRSSAGDLLLAVTLAAQVQQEMSGLTWSALFLHTALRAAARYLWFTDYQASRSPRIAVRNDAPVAVRDAIRFRDVTFRYPGTGNDVLRDVDLTIPAGSVVAIVGDNGAGKTTLVKLLCRFYEPTSGSITVDGTDLATIPHEDWRTRLSGAFQDFARIEVLVRETVGVGDLHAIGDSGAVGAALGRAGASDVPEQLASGLETQLGKRWTDGTDLSMGQWQKLALGRAMMRTQPLLLVLDEPTASLDAQTEHALFERYADAACRADAVTVLVSHRFSTVRMADLIVVLDEGRVVERGSHDELVAKRGLYAELYELQASAYR